MARSYMCVRDLTVIFPRVDVHVSLIQRRFLFTTKRMTKTTTEDICATLKKKEIIEFLRHPPAFPQATFHSRFH